MIAISRLTRRHPLLVGLVVGAILVGFAIGGGLSHGLEQCLEALAAACLLVEFTMMPLFSRVMALLSRLVHFSLPTAIRGSSRRRHPAHLLLETPVLRLSVRLQV